VLSEWTQAKLEGVRDCPRVVLQDPLHLLPEIDGIVHSFALEHGFTVVVAGTNLVFRDLYERALADSGTQKLLVVDRAPQRRRVGPPAGKAPPPFYPDLLADTPAEARIVLDLRQFLIEKTGDPNWPAEASSPRYAHVIVRNLDSVLRAHHNLRTAHPSRFTDHDFKTIVAFSALGVAETAFKKLKEEGYWRIGLLGHEAMGELESLAPEITAPIRDELRKAPAPFCWFAGHDPDRVVRGFYLSVILAQHTGLWSFILAKIDPDAGSLSDIGSDVMTRSAPKLVEMDREKAYTDLESAESSLSSEALQVLLDQLKLVEPEGFAAVIEKERYSSLLRCLALFLALDDMLSVKPAVDAQKRVGDVVLLSKAGPRKDDFLESRPSLAWANLKKAYRLAWNVLALRGELATGMKGLKVLKTDRWTFAGFRDLWNKKKVNRLEYYLSALDRLVYSSELLPRPEAELPSVFGNALARMRKRVVTLAEDSHRQLDDLNRMFQEVVAMQYPAWVAEDSDVCLTSAFLKRCLKPHWDPQKEKAVLFIFDGMRYDIWDEMLRPMLEARMKIVEELPASSLIPSETHISRKAISAGTYPDEFDTHAAEDRLLHAGLVRHFGQSWEVQVLAPDGGGVGETVRYRAGNLDIYIFELCDKELHKIQVKSLPDGRQVPARPLSFIYQHHLKGIIDTEVMAIVRGLAPGTKVFVTADHGFGRVGRQKIGLETAWLQDPADCSYQNTWLPKRLAAIGAPEKVRDNVLEFRVADLRMPSVEGGRVMPPGGAAKKYASVIFPRTGYALARPGAHFNPDAYGHGGISLQELMVPMVVLEVKSKGQGALSVAEIAAPVEVVEGQEVEFHLSLKRASGAGASKGDLRVEVEASYTRDPERHPLRAQVLYVPAQGTEAVYRFRPDAGDATDDERKQGRMERTFTVTLTHTEGNRSFRQARTHQFTVQLSSEHVVRRVPPHLGNILGLKPKSMR